MILVNRSMWKYLAAAATLSLAACGPASQNSSSGGGTAAGGSGAAGGGTGAGGGGTMAELSAAECQRSMSLFAGAGCSDASTYSMFHDSICPEVSSASSALCAPALSRAKTSLVDLQNATFVCNAFNQTDTTAPSAVDALLAVTCVASMNNNLCAGLTCQFNQDCPSGYSCNDATEKCFNTSADCIGMPCMYGQDCPTGFTCNSGVGQCTKG